MPAFPLPLPLTVPLRDGLSLVLSRAPLDLDRFEHLSPEQVDAVALVMRDGGEAVGKGTFHVYGENWGSFEEIYVAPGRRRQGIASSVYDAVEELGIDVVPSAGRSWLGEALWEARETRRAAARFAA